MQQDTCARDTPLPSIMGGPPRLAEARESHAEPTPPTRPAMRPAFRVAAFTAAFGWLFLGLASDPIADLQSPQPSTDLGVAWITMQHTEIGLSDPNALAFFAMAMAMLLSAVWRCVKGAGA